MQQCSTLTRPRVPFSLTLTSPSLRSLAIFLSHFTRTLRNEEERRGSFTRPTHTTPANSTSEIETGRGKSNTRKSKSKDPTPRKQRNVSLVTKLPLQDVLQTIFLRFRRLQGSEKSKSEFWDFVGFRQSARLCFSKNKPRTKQSECKSVTRDRERKRKRESVGGRTSAKHKDTRGRLFWF